MTIQNPTSRLQNPMLWLFVCALLLGPITILQQNALTNAWQPLPVFVAFLIAWGIFASGYLDQIPRWHTNRRAYRTAEMVVIALLTRLVTWTWVDGWPSAAEWNDYLINPSQLFTGSWGIYLFFGLWGWAWMLALLSIFKRLQISQKELDYYNQSPTERGAWLQTPMRHDRSAIFVGLQYWWLYGGLILILCTAATTVPLREVGVKMEFRGIGRLPIPPLMLASLLLYLFVGLWLISYARYIVLNARWLNNDTSPYEQVHKSWRRNSAGILFIVATVASFLPIGSSFAIATILRTLIIGFVFVGTTILNVFLVIIGLLLSPFGQASEAVEAIEMPPPPIIPPLTETPTQAPTIPPAVTGAIFWIVLGGIVIAAVIFLLYERGYLTHLPQWREGWQKLVAWWQSLWRGVKARAEDVGQAIRGRLGREDETADSPKKPRFVRINALSPRDQIRYFYLATVRRAAEKGVERSSAETPTEFLTSLQDQWPESAEDSQALTDAFLHARYSPRPVEKEAVSPLKQTWKRVRGSLRRKKNAKD